MKILFLAPSYLDLYHPILDMMKHMGHDVLYIEDKTPDFYPYYKRGRLEALLFRLYNSLKNVEIAYQKYWDKIINDYQLDKNKFDVFFCINGTSLHQYFINFLEIQNQNIYKTLYLWDTNRCYDFERFVKYFDKVYTFDLFDSRTMSIEYLPFYYVERKVSKSPIKYDAFCIGSLHDNRLSILDKISKQLDNYSYKYLFKVVYNPIDSTIKTRLRYYISYLINNSVERKERKYKMGLCTHEFLTTARYSLNEYNDLMIESKVIIDTDREMQTGLTPRLVWAIANGKRIITTNKKILDDPYCPKEGIWIIDREKPYITNDMFNNQKTIQPTETFKNLEIKEWIKNFIPVL